MASFFFFYSILFPEPHLPVHLPICLPWTRLESQTGTCHTSHVDCFSICLAVTVAIRKSCFPLFVAFQYITPVPPTFPVALRRLVLPGAARFPAATRALPPPSSTRPARRLKGAVTELFALRAQTPPPPQRSDAYNTREWNNIVVQTADRQTVAAELAPRAKAKGTNLLRVCSVTLYWKKKGGGGQRKTDPWPLQNHLTFTVSLFSL